MQAQMECRQTWIRVMSNVSVSCVFASRLAFSRFCSIMVWPMGHTGYANSRVRTQKGGLRNRESCWAPSQRRRHSRLTRERIGKDRSNATNVGENAADRNGLMKSRNIYRLVGAVERSNSRSTGSDMWCAECSRCVS